jgi:hypothetical protein
MTPAPAPPPSAPEPETTVLHIANDGSCLGLYSEVIDLTSLGPLSIQRVSHVEWDQGRQGWTVIFGMGEVLPHVYPSRQAALDAEVAYIRQHFEAFRLWFERQRRS